LLTGGERRIILEALDALNAIRVQDEKFPSAVCDFVCFAADEATMALEEPNHPQILLYPNRRAVGTLCSFA
jgi:hypothetical protein